MPDGQEQTGFSAAIHRKEDTTNTDIQANYRNIGDISFTQWSNELDRVDSPLRTWSRDMYEVVRGHSALALAHMWRECQYETDRLVLKPSDHNPFNMKRWPADPRGLEGIRAVGTVPTGLPGDAPYLRFDSPVSAAREWRRRVIDDPDYKGGVYTGVRSLAAYIETYAPAADFHAITGENNSTYFRDMIAILTRFGRQDTTPQEHPMATQKVHVILIAGHNSVGDGGNSVERALTPKLAAAYLTAFNRDGIPAEWINPTLTPGGLDGLAQLTARKIRDADADLVLALDLHFNGSRSGVHTIVAHNRSQNGGQLATAYVQGRVAADTADLNTLDVQLARKFSAAIVADVSGMSLWGADGVMLENQTGVGLPLAKGGKNSRLAMMSASAPFRDKAVRLTIEHGGTDDAAKPDFAAKCAGAVLKSVKTVLADRMEAGQANPDPATPAVPQGDTGSPTLTAFLFGSANGYAFDPDGLVSRLWLTTGNRTGEWPRLVDVLEQGGNKHFVFGNGSVIVHEAGKPVAYLQTAA